MTVRSVTWQSRATSPVVYVDCRRSIVMYKLYKYTEYTPKVNSQ